MSMHNLSNTQIVLLAILVSFVTSIATTILTDAFVQSSPQTVTQTVNRVVERTVETVLPAETKVVEVVKPSTMPSDDERIAAAITKNEPSVVTIFLRSDTSGDTSAVTRGSADTFQSGVFISNDGLILTTANSVRDGAVYGIAWTGKSEGEAQVIKIDTEKNLAILALRNRPKTIPAEFAASSGTLGRRVLSLGRSDAGLLVVSGIITSVQGGQAIGTDIAVGTSMVGGSLVDLDGKMLGLSVSATGSQRGAAIPAAVILSFIR